MSKMSQKDVDAYIEQARKAFNPNGTTVFKMPIVKSMRAISITTDVFNSLVVGDEIEGHNGIPYAVVGINRRVTSDIIDVMAIDPSAHQTTFTEEDIACVIRYASYPGQKHPITAEVDRLLSLEDVKPKCNCGAVHADWKIPHSDYCWLVTGIP